MINSPVGVTWAAVLLSCVKLVSYVAHLGYNIKENNLL